MDDLISRREAIDRINKQREHLQPDIYPQDKIGDAAYRICAEFIERLPSAQPEIEERTKEFAQNVPKEDLISRNAAIEAVEHITSSMSVCVNTDECHGMKRMQRQAVIELANLPSVQQEQHWIPVSERLPEYGVAVLTYDGHCFCVEKRIPTIRDDEGEPITGDWWVSDDYNEYDGDYYPNLRDGACIAWMPLPEPYRAERRTDE